MSPNQDPGDNTDPRFKELTERLAGHNARHQIFGQRVDISTEGIGIPVVENDIYGPDSMSDEQQSNS